MKSSDNEKSDTLEASDQWRVPASTLFYGRKEYGVPFQSPLEWGGLVAFQERDLATVSTSMVLAQLCCLFTGAIFFVLFMVGLVFVAKYLKNNSDEGEAPSWMMYPVYGIVMTGTLLLYACLAWYKRKQVAERLQETTENELSTIFKKLGWRIEYDTTTASFLQYFMWATRGTGTYVFSRSLEAPEKQEPLSISTSPVHVDFVPSLTGYGLHLLLPNQAQHSADLLWILGGMNEEMARNHGMPTLCKRADISRAALSLLALALFMGLPGDILRHWFLLILAFVILLSYLLEVYWKKVVDDSGALEQAFSEMLPVVEECCACSVEYMADSASVPWFPKCNRRLVFTPTTQESTLA